MSGRPRTRSDAEVFAAVMRAVGRRGPARLTLADVAVEVGLAPSTLAERFGSKRALLLAAVGGSTLGVDAAFERARAAEQDPLSALPAALVALTGPVRTRAALANHLALLQLDLADEEFRRAAALHAGRMRAQIHALLADAATRGALDRAGDLDALARAVHVSYNGALVTWAVDGDGRLEDSLRSDLEAVIAPWREAPTRLRTRSA